MQPHLKVLLIDASSGFYKIERFNLGSFWGPVDLGIHLAHKHNSLNIGTGLLAGSVFSGSNRLVFSGISPCWHGFFVSSMGGAGLIFDNLGINLLAIKGKSTSPSILYLNRSHGEQIEVELRPINLEHAWEQGRKGFYGLMEYAYSLFGSQYETDPRILATGAASLYTDFGAIGSAPLKKGKFSYADTWAGRGGFGSKMLQQHGVAAIIYGGTHIDDDFRDRTVADSWFEDRFQKKLSSKQFEATTKYRFDPAFNTGGTFGVNYATMGDNILAFNYRTINWTPQERGKLHKEFILDHYLKQFNEETIETRSQATCGEPCAAVCKKLHKEFKKDYEPYQTMGPLCGIFDQRAAEALNQKADTLGFDAISIGGILSWLMECLHENLIAPEELGVDTKPIFEPEGFNIVESSMHNARLGLALIDRMIGPDRTIDLMEGPRKFGRHLARKKGRAVLDLFVYCAFARHGWIVPNQYWTAGVLSPMGIMGKYYNDYGRKFIEPRKLGQLNALRMEKELMLDNLGICRFHRAWAEEMIPDIVDKLFGNKEGFLKAVKMAASRINSRNSSVFWEPKRNITFLASFLKKSALSDKSPELEFWLNKFEADEKQASIDFWYEIHKGVHETLLEF